MMLNRPSLVGSGRFYLLVALLFSFLSSPFAFSRQEDPASPGLRAAIYAEEGHWFAHVYRVDDEGWPETLERKAFANEPDAITFASLRGASVDALEFRPSEDTPASLRSTSRTSTGTRAGIAPRELRTPNAGEVWTAENAWSIEWEDRFAEWTRKNFDRDFFVRYGIKTDCADAAVALRWIFAREMKLPAGNRLVGGDALLTNRSVRNAWRSLPRAEAWYEDARFLAALEYVLENTYTHTLNQDAYPIEIDPKYLTEGTFHLELRSTGGHTRVISRIDRDGKRYPIHTLWSNVPRIVRRLYEEPFTVWEQPPLRFGGLLRHRWVRFGARGASLVRAEDMPGFSLEQYDRDFFRHGVEDYSAEVSRRIREVFDPVLALEAIFANIRGALEERKRVVAEGFAFCQHEDCAPGSENYENWSTPSRDRRILGYFQQVRNYRNVLRGKSLKKFERKYRRLSRKKIRIEGEKYRFSEIETLWMNERFSSDPTASPRRRWGLH